MLCKQGVTSSSLVSSTRPNTPTKISGRGARAINVPLALAGRLDLTVQRVSNGTVGRRRGVLVDHRSASAVVTHSRLEVSQAHSGRGQGVACVPQVMEVQARNAELADCASPARVTPEVAPP